MVPKESKLPKQSKTVTNGPKRVSNSHLWWKMVQKIKQRSKMVQNGPTISKIVPHGPKWSKMVQMVPNGSKRFYIVPSNPNGHRSTLCFLILFVFYIIWFLSEYISSLNNFLLFLGLQDLWEMLKHEIFIKRW